MASELGTLRVDTVTAGASLISALRCPVCLVGLQQQEEVLNCTNPDCRRAFPIIDGIPILIDEENSVFRIADYRQRRVTTAPQRSKFAGLAARVLPKLTRNVKARQNFRRFLDTLVSSAARPKVLVVGGRIAGSGMSEFLADRRLDVIATDVAAGPEVRAVADAHSLPFDDGTFDGVVAQAVLEHVLDPHRCVSEILRVLKHGGIVYAETPFMQQVHAGRYDFTRFTDLGHRRLFSGFEEISRGATCGPGSALAWSYQHFLLSFVSGKHAINLVKAFTSLTGFWLPFFDQLLIDTPGAQDAASGYFFLGRKTHNRITDTDLLRLYRGNQQ